MLKRELAEKLIYGHEFAGRFTQDSPVLPDVWIVFGEAPGRRHDLLLTPFIGTGAQSGTAGQLSQALRERLRREAGTAVWRRLHGEGRPAAQIAYNQSTVAARLTFGELVRVVLPLSRWWTDRIVRPGFSDQLAALSTPRGQLAVAGALAHPEGLRSRSRGSDSPAWLTLDVAWMVRVIGTLGLAEEVARGSRETAGTADAKRMESVWPTDLRDAPGRQGESPDLRARRLAYCRRIVAKVGELMKGLIPVDESVHAAVYSVSRNRRAGTTVWRSRAAVKADAVSRVFDVTCGDLSWAVIDSGIDARHPAFRKRYMNREKNRSLPEPLPKSVAEIASDSDTAAIHVAWVADNKDRAAGRRGNWSDRSRVVATYDFTIIRHLLAGVDGAEEDSEASDSPAEAGTLSDGVKGRLARVHRRLERKHASGLTSELRTALNSGRELDWALLEPFLRVPHDADYEVPVHEHGTHVAGILGGDWRKADEEDRYPALGDLVGLCPDIALYDLRVLDENGEGDEFNVMAALQFVRSLNAHRDYRVIHGVNLSLSIPHDVANYACGRTPVCEECERLVGSGLVVVAAAGNDGYLQYMTAKGLLDGYRSISITDPGNAEGVITVGSTHRDQPHTYGVSYFSSRGPTGDGRVKPDLVAPGEKIDGPVPHREAQRKDGTSMAAPHVSGAAALLIARHRELAGQPRRIKEILCRTATDLGRERYFQGSGMLDVLRALQSV
ncbi:MAG: S8 family serine peptidase [Limisphaerales bacterium]